jgi:CBS domain-containing protein
MPIQNAVSIREVMSKDILTVGPEESIPEATRRISERNIGAAIVEPETHGLRPGIITERDVLDCVASGRRAEYLHVADLFTPDAMTIPPDASLQQAAKAMTSDGFRHLVVFDGEEILGIVSIRDIVGRWSKEGQLPGLGTQIRDAMTTEVFAVGLEDTLREAARKMSERGIGAAMVEPEKEGRPPGMISAREILHSVAAGQDPDTGRVADHLAPRRTFSAPDWSLSQAAEAMSKGGFQHIVVVDMNGIAGILSMRDLMRSLVRSSTDQ